jgi:hypothetical protein
MSIKLKNDKTGETATCERADWSVCRDHKPSKGWSLWVPNSVASGLDLTNVTESDSLTFEEYSSPKTAGFKFKEIYSEEERKAILELAAPYKEKAMELYKELGLHAIRKDGIGSNFKVSNPEDGYRKDNRVWFGTCETCQSHVSSSLFDKAWVHSLSSKIVGSDGKEFSSGRSMVSSYACPEAL